MSDSTSASIERMLRPQTAAVIGASTKPASPGGRPLRYLKDAGLDALYAVNPARSEVQGVPSLESPDLLPDVVDLVVVAVPSAATIDAVRAMAGKDIGTIVVLTAGFRELSADGSVREQELVDAARKCGARVVGPNCSGVANIRDRVFATMSTTVDGPVVGGSVALISQSGGLGASIFALSQRARIGVDYFVTTGNEADINTSDFVAHFVEDPGIQIVAVTSEGVRNPALMLAAAERARALGKQLVYLSAGNTKAGARAARSHTAALVGAPAALAAVLDQHGILRASSIEEMFDVIKVLRAPERPRGSHVGIITQTGGGGVLMADALESEGIGVPRLSVADQQRLSTVVKGYGSVLNPVDVTGQMSSDPSLFEDALLGLSECESIDVIAAILGPNRSIAERMANSLVAFRTRSSKPMVVTWLGGMEIGELTQASVAAYGDPYAAARSIAALLRAADVPNHRMETPDEFEPTPAVATGPVLLEHDALALLAQHGLPVVRGIVANTSTAAVDAARELTYPVVLKVLASSMLHRAHLGGVAVGLTDDDSVTQAYEDLVAAAAKAGAREDLVGILVEPMIRGDLELHVGMVREGDLGPILSVGLGGTLMEILDAKTLLGTPLSLDQARRAVAGLCGGRLVTHPRGLSGTQAEELAALLVRFAEFSAVRPDVSEFDCNPIIAAPDGLRIVDALIVMTGDSEFSNSSTEGQPWNLT
jgi:acyl-CoA synthetase (NDP forming)